MNDRGLGRVENQIGSQTPPDWAQVDCQNDFFLSCDWRVSVMRLRADISTKSKNKVGSRAAVLWHRERGTYDLDR
jgi:hypothetical protein